jgi:thioredoxin 1
MLLELTADNFQKDVIESPVPVLVDFWSPGCGPCRRLAPVIDEIARESDGRFAVGKVNIWDEPDVGALYSLKVVPTLLVFQRGKVVNTLIGYHDRRKLLEALQPFFTPRDGSS